MSTRVILLHDAALERSTARMQANGGLQTDVDAWNERVSLGLICFYQQPR